MKRVAVQTVVALLLVGLAAGLYLYNAPNQSSGQLRLGSGSAARSYRLEVVSDSAGQTRGLGGRAKMAKDTAMLFAYDGVAERCIWMKDMRFAIDVAWVGSDKRITHIVPDMSPSSYPQTYCAEAQYVIELQAGEMSKRKLLVGHSVSF